MNSELAKLLVGAGLVCMWVSGYELGKGGSPAWFFVTLVGSASVCLTCWWLESYGGRR